MHEANDSFINWNFSNKNRSENLLQITLANRTRLNRMNQSDAADTKRGKKRVNES